METSSFTSEKAERFLSEIVRKKLTHFICHFSAPSDGKDIYLIDENMLCSIGPKTSFEERNTLYKLCICLNKGLIKLPEKLTVSKKEYVTILGISCDDQLREAYGNSNEILKSKRLSNQFVGIVPFEEPVISSLSRTEAEEALRVLKNNNLCLFIDEQLGEYYVQNSHFIFAKNDLTQIQLICIYKVCFALNDGILKIEEYNS